MTERPGESEVSSSDPDGRWREALVGFEGRFPHEQACREYLERVRWPDGYHCGTCGGRTVWRTGDGRYLCVSCKRGSSLTAGTVFHRSRLGLRKWFEAAWLVTESSSGISALELQAALGLASYESAWALLHRVRRVMASSAPSRLAGPVALGLFEVDVVERAGTPRRNGAITVVAAVEQAAQTRRGRIGLSALRDPGALQVVDFTRRTVQSNATVRTSADAAFGQLGPAGFVHETFESTPDSDVVPDALIDLESALVSWLTGNLHRGVSDVHLGWYLAEIAFRWNVPSDAGSGARFDRLLELAARHEPVPFRDLIGQAGDLIT